MKTCRPRLPLFYRATVALSLFLSSLLPPSQAAEPSLPPSPRPPEISTEDWQKIFGEEAQVIVARLKAANGITYYEFRNWDPNHWGIGGARTYVLAENGQVLVPWRFQLFGDDPPPWVRLGLSFPEAVAMEKQVYQKYIQLWGFEEARKGSLDTYMDKLAATSIDYYYPEVIEAQKELGLLPKDFVPPPLSPRRQRSLGIMLGEEEPKPQFTAEQNRAITAKLIELVRANGRGDKAAIEKASRELDEIMRPKPSEPNASSEREKP